MKAVIAGMSLVLMTAMSGPAAQSQSDPRPGRAATGANRANPRIEIGRVDIFVCPRHPEAKATWSARCPMCQMQMRRQSSPGKPDAMGMDDMMESMMQSMPAEMRLRHQMMMNTPIRVYDPETLLGSAGMLGLTPQQVQELRTIAMRARRAAMAVLTEVQRQKLMPLERLTNFPLSMAQSRQRMMERMSSDRGMRGDPATGGRPQKKDPPAADPEGRNGFSNRDGQAGEGDGIEGQRGFNEGRGFGGRFNNNEGFGDNQRFGSGSEFEFGPGFGGNEGFGYGNEFGTGPGFGDGEFGNNGGLGGNEGFRGNQDFRGSEGSRGNEGLGNNERSTSPSRGR